MVVIPVINCLDSECVKDKLKTIQKLGSPWVHIDIADGKFAPVMTWNKPAELVSNLNVEVHLMVQDPEVAIRDWLKMGAKRIIVHVETIRDFNFLKNECTTSGTQLMLALKPDTSIESLSSYLTQIDFIQILAVNPGWAGQKFQTSVLGKIKFLKKSKPQIKIEIDGGINPETARLVKMVGADIIVSANYIFSHQNPEAAIRELANI